MYWSLSNEATNFGVVGRAKKKKKMKKKECVWWKCCIMYVWYHFVLLIGIIDMILAKCFLNNWIIYYCLCYLSVSQTWTKSSPFPVFCCFFSLGLSVGVTGLLPFSPHTKRLVLWTKVKKQEYCPKIKKKKKKRKKSIRTSALMGLMWMALASENVIIKEKFVVQL